MFGYKYYQGQGFEKIRCTKLSSIGGGAITYKKRRLGIGGLG
jgi:hypothetical protein